MVCLHTERKRIDSVLEGEEVNGMGSDLFRVECEEVGSERINWRNKEENKLLFFQDFFFFLSRLFDFGYCMIRETFAFYMIVSECFEYYECFDYYMVFVCYHM